METVPHKVLDGDDPPTSGARTIIKRAMRKARFPVYEDNTSLSGFFIAHPWACTAQIEARIESAAQAWIDGSNSGNDRALQLGEKRCDLYRAHVERLMWLIDVELDYPGLYPCYRWRGHDYHDLSSLWASMKHERAIQ